MGGYVRDRRGRITTFEVPGTASTAPLDNNDRGQIVGVYLNPEAMPGAPRGRMT